MKLFIGCGSSDDVDKIYFEESNKLLNILLQDNDLVFGAYDKGLMGESLKIAKKNNRVVIAAARDKHLDDVKQLKCTKEIITTNILDRTKALINESDAIIFLPGGIGTINEIFASIDSKRNGDIDKPIIFYNINHYYDKLFDFLDHLYNEKFTVSSVKNTYFIAYNVNEVVDYLYKNTNILEKKI